ncbi:MAG: hypothetical protein LUC49_04920, partial [Prevotella sp.]|nr:hypothetical protein [Prevotella sp.]
SNQARLFCRVQPRLDKVKARANESNQARLFCRVQPRLDKVNGGRGRGSLKLYLFTAVFLFVFAFIFWLVLKPSPKHQQVPLRPDKIQSLNKPHKIISTKRGQHVVDTFTNHQIGMVADDTTSERIAFTQKETTHDTIRHTYPYISKEHQNSNISTEKPTHAGERDSASFPREMH